MSYKKPEVANLSFSLIFPKHEHLNLVASDDQQYQLWTSTLEYLIYNKEASEEYKYE